MKECKCHAKGYGMYVHTLNSSVNDLSLGIRMLNNFLETSRGKFNPTYHNQLELILLKFQRYAAQVDPSRFIGDLS